MLPSIGWNQEVTKAALRSSIECRVFVLPKNRLAVVQRYTVGERVWPDPPFSKGGMKGAKRCIPTITQRAIFLLWYPAKTISVGLA